jgi:hypothetical protein
VIDYSNIFKSLTYDRLSKYRENPSVSICYSEEETIKRYIYNIELSSSFNRAVHVFEVVLRNRTVESWNNMLGTSDWPLNGKGIPNSGRYQKMGEDIEKAIHRAGKNSDNGKIVAELSLGFWLHLFDKKFQQQNFKMIKNIFEFKTEWNSNLAISINQIKTDISKIHQLRNRIAHHEPIFHYKDLNLRYELIKNYITWLNPSCVCLINEEQFYSILKNGWKGIVIPVEKK